MGSEAQGIAAEADTAEAGTPEAGTPEAATLDDPARVRAIDAGGMLGLVASLGQQLRDGFARALGTPALPSAEGLTSVVVCGMGGSGVAGDVLRAVLSPEAAVPVHVVKGYALPAFCDSRTLVIAVSFSGNTEETLAAYAEGASRGCRLVAASAGGELAALAEADDVPHVAIPGDIPMPRAALGHLAAAPLAILDVMGLVPPLEARIDGVTARLAAVAEALGPDRPVAENEAKSIATWLLGRTPVVWGSDGVGEAAALRWKTQLNENAKVPAWAAALPELAHNEVEGWSGGSRSGHAVVVLRRGGEPPAIAARATATADVVAGCGIPVRDVRVQAGDPLEQLLSLVMVGDFVSVYLAVLRGVDPMPIPLLSSLKERLRR